MSAYRDQAGEINELMGRSKEHKSPEISYLPMFKFTFLFTIRKEYKHDNRWQLMLLWYEEHNREGWYPVACRPHLRKVGGAAPIKL